MDKITLIIPVYNGEKYLRECLDSAVNQSYDNYEIIVVNDGSTDRTREICREYEVRFGFLKTIHHAHNQGVVRSWEDGVLAASGSYIAAMDSDDWADRQYLEQLSSGIAQEADIVCCNYNKVFPDRTVLQIERIRPGLYSGEQIGQHIFPVLLNDGTYLSRGISPHRCGKLFRRTLLLDNLRFCDARIGYGEDLNLVFAAILDCNKLMILDDRKGLYNYRQNEASVIYTYKRNMFRQITLLRDALRSVMHEKAVFDFTEQIDRDYWCLFFEYIKNETKAENLLRSSKEVFVNYQASIKSIPYHSLALKFTDKFLLFCLQRNKQAFVYLWMRLYALMKKVV